METLETLLACVYPEAGSGDSDSEDEGCVGCACDVAILDEGVEEAARRPDAVEMKELTAWSRERLNKLKRHRAEAVRSISASSVLPMSSSPPQSQSQHSTASRPSPGRWVTRSKRV